ncbi:enoyl-CoA hydratase-related protein [Aquamicrobium sp. LC103]|uniref:enoyl-CoA hydratase-related protein n=1 Tax=Aquamicrobium sp. LC103 TaxID=1120658 RepID=UPI00063E96AF|nr:enoyl-CoA hydratase-related protein [Aquamicrobium sp. LC103]TKT74492.1 enoyl-CoA hydratase [Aquamicrobium sp. LC103]
MSEQPVIIKRHGRVAVLTLNEPKTRNALSRGIIHDLVSFLRDANADTSLSAIVLTGAGEVFSSGGNVQDMYNRSHEMFAGSPHDMQEGYRNHIQQIPLAFHALDVPVVAAVNGVAIGAGCDLACMADIRIASPAARFAESFLRVGLVPGDGGAWFLPRVVGMPRAVEMALTCEMVEAERAERWGLATRIVPAENLLDEAIAVAEKIATFPPRSVRLNKRLMRQSASMSLPDSLELAAAFQAIVQNTDDQAEAVAALVEKRAPSYTGK